MTACSPRSTARPGPYAAPVPCENGSTRWDFSECELAGDGVVGIAVHIGARVAALAGPDEVLVSSTVRDLVAGSGLEFVDRGTHSLKGVPDAWRVFVVR